MTRVFFSGIRGLFKTKLILSPSFHAEKHFISLCGIIPLTGNKKGRSYKSVIWNNFTNFFFVSFLLPEGLFVYFIFLLTKIKCHDSAEGGKQKTQGVFFWRRNNKRWFKGCSRFFFFILDTPLEEWSWHEINRIKKTAVPQPEMKGSEKAAPFLRVLHISKQTEG